MGARYGKDVRSSIVNAIDAVNTESNNSVTKVNAAESRVNTAVSNANAATTAANTAATKANTAAANANEAAQAVLDEKYILTARTEMIRSGTARPTAKGNAILEKLTGDSWQNQLTGKNLWPHGDVIGNVKYFVSKNINLKAGTYTVSAVIETTDTDDTVSLIAFGYEDGTTEYVYIPRNGRSSKSFKLSKDIIDAYFYGGSTHQNSANETFSYKDIQIEEGPEATDYEPYCGGIPSSNPEFPQAIRSTGDMGWFDGEWLQGFYNAQTGEYAGNDYLSSNGVCNKNFIPCNGGDAVKLIADKVYKSLNIAFYDINKSFVSFKCEDNIKEYEITAPTNAKYFNFYIANGTAITPSTVGHVCVTINGKYAAIVDEVGKNLFDINKALVGSFNTDGDYRIGHSLSEFYLYNWKENTQYTFSAYVKNHENNKGNVRFAIQYTDGSKEQTVLFNSSTEYKNMKFTSAKDKTISRMYVVYGDAGYMYIQKGELQIEEGDKATPYTPHQSKRTYIPLDEPLRGIGDVKNEIKCVDGLYGAYREYSEKVYKGSDFINISNAYSSVKYYALPKPTDSKYYNNNGQYETICDKFEYNLQYGIDNEYCIHLLSSNASTTHLWFGFPIGTSLEEVQAIGEIKVVYPLAEPIFTPFEDQTPFYNLQSFDEVTHVSIAGLHEKLQPTLTMRFPRYEDGALVTTSYCNSKKTEIRMDKLTAAMLALNQN